MVDTATKPNRVAKPSENAAAHQLVRPIRAAQRERVFDRASELSDEVLKSLGSGERAAIEALGQFVITIEEALPQEVLGTSEVAKKVTESSLDMADRLVHTQYDVLRDVIASTAKSLRSRGEAKPKAAQ